MALINVAWILASNGKRVLVLDWDLEAPGLHRYLAPFLADKELIASDGLIDFVHKFITAAASHSPISESSSQNPAREWYHPYANILRYATSIEWKFDEPGTLDFIPAGRQGASYSTRVNSFNWQFFYSKLGGGSLLEMAKERMKDEYDFILIDSRTGVSDTSGICTVQMPDALVICFTLNNQSIEGAAAVAQSISEQRRAADKEIQIFPVPMRIEIAEKRKLDVRTEVARLKLGSFPDSLASDKRDEYWKGVQVLYIPYYAYEEILACFEDKRSDKVSMLESCEQLTSYLTDGDVRRLKSPSPADRQRVLQEYEGRAYEVGRFADGVLAYFDPAEQEAARWLLTRLIRVKPDDELGEDTLIQVPILDIETGATGMVDSLLRVGLLARDSDKVHGEVLRAADPNLLENWPQLQRFVAAEREFLKWRDNLHQLAQAWAEGGREDSLLLRDERVEEAAYWQRERKGQLTNLENLFIQKSIRFAGSSDAEKQYDVFLSYNRAYRADAERLFGALEERGLSVAWDAQLTPGRPLMPELEAVIRSSRSAVVLVGSELGPWQAIEIQLALDKQVRERASGRALPVIPVLLPGAMIGSIFLGLNTYLQLKDAVADAAEIDAITAAILGTTMRERQEALSERILQAVCPYRGLLAFREEDAEFFYGRDDVILKLEEALEKSPAVALVGSSGSGKSSVVYAGLIPRLRKQGDGKVWSFVTLRPSDRPFRAIASTLISLSEIADTTAVERVRKINDLTADLESGNLTLADLLEDHRKKVGVGRLLLVVDQWEDLYTLCKDEEVRQKLVDQISRVVLAQPLAMICMLRRDFLPRALAEPGLGDRLKSSLIYLPPMNEQQRRAAVVEPAGKVGLAFQDGLVDRILDDVGGEPGQLSLLELVLTELWEKRKGDLLSFRGYDELGEARGAIALHAEKFFTSLDEQSQENVRRVFLALVRSEEGTEDTRRRVHPQELGVDWRDTLQRLVSARLLTISLDSEDNTESALDESEATIEIAHGALLNSWSRLRRWLDEDREFLLWRERLRTSLSSWEHAGLDRELLLTHTPLFEAHNWFLRRGTDLTEAERAFVRESWRKHQERDVERVRRRRISLSAVVGSAVFCLCIVLFGVWRWWIHFSRDLAAQAAGLHEGPRDIALLLALQAEEMYDTPEAHSSLLGLLEESQSLQAFLPGHKGTVTAVTYSPDGSTFATAGRDKIFLWDAATGKRLDPPLVGHSGRILGLAFKDRSTLASCGEDQTIQIWQVGSHQRLQAPKKVGLTLRNLAFSPDGSLLAASSGKTVYLWDYPSLRLRDKTLPHAAWVSSLAFRRDGVLASSSRDTITLWSPTLGTKVSSFSAPSADGKAHQILALAFSPRTGSQVLATAGEDGMVRLWNSTTGEQLGEPREAHRDRVTSLAFSQDGKRLASAGQDHVIHLWDVEKEQWDSSNRHPVQALLGQGRAIWALAFGADGHLVSGGDEGAVVLWNPAAPSRFVTKARGITGEIDSVAFSSDGQTLFAGGKDGILWQWDTVSQHVGEKVPAHAGRIAALALQGQNLISAGGEDGRILLWDSTDLRKPPQPFERSTDSSAIPIGSLALSSDKRIVAAGDDASDGSDGRVRLWRADTRQFLGELEHRIPGLYALALDPHGKLLATGNLRGEIQLWDVQSRRHLGKPLKADDLNILSITSLAFNPKGDILASSKGDNTVWLWSMGSRQPLLGSPLTGAKGLVTNLAFSPQGDRLAASSLDGTVFLWDVKSRSAIGTGLKGEGSLLNVAFHPEDDYLVSGTDQSLLLFDLHYSALQDMACKIVRRDLTEAERGRFLDGDIFYTQVCPNEDNK